MGEQIAQFLGIPFADRRSPTVSATLTTLKETIQEEIHTAQKKREEMEKRLER